jgi:hypothetical protein
MCHEVIRVTFIVVFSVIRVLRVLFQLKTILSSRNHASIERLLHRVIPILV